MSDSLTPPISSTPFIPPPAPKPMKKRKNTAVEVHEKLKAVQKMKNGCPRQIVAKELGVHPSTVDGWLKNERTLQKWETDHNGIMPKAKKRLRKPVHESIDKAMWLWYRELNSAGRTFTGPGVKVQALHFRNQLRDNTTFSASQGWLTKWQRRYGVKFATSNPTSASTSVDQPLLNDDETADKARVKFASMVEAEGLTSDQVFFCDLIGLNYRQLPDLLLNVAWAPEGHPQKRHKERITIMACSNASGSFKLPLVLIGKFPKPRAIKNLSLLPVYYRHQMSSYVTGDIFTEWFNNEFFPAITEFLVSRGLSAKAILFMDNCLSLPKELSRQDVRVEFLPPNTTAMIQPVDQGWMRNLKVSYRQQLMKFLMNNLSVGVSLDDAMKNLTIREVIFWIANSWSKLSDAMIMKSWKPLWPQIEKTDSSRINIKLEDNSPDVLIKNEDVDATDSFTGLFQQNENALIREFCDALNRTNEYKSINFGDIERWLHPVTKVTEDECLDEDEIVQIVLEENEANQQIIEKPPPPEKPKVTLAEAQASLKKVIEYCSQSAHYTREQRLTLIAIRESMKTQSSSVAASPAPIEPLEIPPFDFVAIVDNEENEYSMYE